MEATEDARLSLVSLIHGFLVSKGPAGPVPLDFTHVIYHSDDLLGLMFAWISMAPQTLIVVYLTLIMSRREVETVLMFAGQVGCEAVNQYLKHVIKEERPRFGYGYGMPSAHAQFMAYYTTYLCLWMLFRVRHFSTRKKLLRGASSLIFSGLVCYSRVYLFYHSGSQVLAGVGIGVAVAIAYFMFVVLLRDLGIVDLLLDTWPARWFYIKDTAGERASFVRDEYAEWRRDRMKMKLLVKVE
ncbi:dolichyldiphosphatase [Trichomonascus vanleenenianus]|uniref:dolichyldiphosphatase n=1 Tax=Trichomonascus vanleenenianus TaxID=2268995 RepID=UPI003EC9977F